MEEIWKDVVGYKNYMVSNLGRIYSEKNGGKILTPSFDGKHRYMQVTLVNNGVVKRELVHRIVAKAFLENPDNKPEVNHKNCVTYDNRVENLEWVTKNENMKHAYKMGKLNPPTYKGKFGKEHNKSFGYKLICPDGKTRTFFSGLEFLRETGLDNTCLSWACRKKTLPYKFWRGKIKGYVLVEAFPSYKIELKG